MSNSILLAIGKKVYERHAFGNLYKIKYHRALSYDWHWCGLGKFWEIVRQFQVYGVRNVYNFILVAANYLQLQIFSQDAHGVTLCAHWNHQNGINYVLVFQCNDKGNFWHDCEYVQFFALHSNGTLRGISLQNISHCYGRNFFFMFKKAHVIQLLLRLHFLSGKTKILCNQVLWEWESCHEYYPMLSNTKSIVQSPNQIHHVVQCHICANPCTIRTVPNW